MPPLEQTPRTRPGPPPVVLGSGSRYRRELLGRLLPEFSIVVPDIDETRGRGEQAPDLARRLARLKAGAIASDNPAAVVIGSDQVAECRGQILGKPGSDAHAIEQLTFCAGQVLFLHTAVCVAGPGDRPALAHLDQTRLTFRALSTQQIASYVARDQPLDCAGSFKFEALGSALFSEVDTRDPTAIQGLPLLWLAGALQTLGVPVL